MTAFDSLQEFVHRHRRLFVLTGAGCSTNSGIPDYRDVDGNWKRQQPVTYQAFMAEEATRQRYLARSLIGWRRFGRALPNDAHRALARLETKGRSEVVLTQNVDRLHQAAGSERVIDLHGRLDLVRCMGCGQKTARDELQDELTRLNAGWLDLDATSAPDGDADLDAHDFSTFVVPAYRLCAGILKPDVVFFGESVPRDFDQPGRNTCLNDTLKEPAENVVVTKPLIAGPRERRVVRNLVFDAQAAKPAVRQIDLDLATEQSSRPKA